MDYLLCMPTHRDGFDEDKAAKMLRDDERSSSIIDLNVIVPKAVGLAAALFLALLSASPKIPGMSANVLFVVSSAIALTACIAWAAWFETLMHRRFALGCVWSVLALVIAGIIAHIPNPENASTAGMILGVIALAAAIVFSIVLATRRMLYPKLDFFLPATGILCIIAILTVT
jgi:hypothetical protein